MTSRKKLTALAVLGALLLILGGLMNGQSGPSGNPTDAQGASKIEPRVLAATQNGQSTSFLILLTDQADVRAAYGMQDQDARGWYVYRTLSEHAARTQTGIRALLQAAGVKYQSFWVANAILCTGGRDLITTLAARGDVRAIEANHPSLWVRKPSVAAPANEALTGIEWNVQNVNAPQVWALGHTGEGIVIGNEDTGMQWDHPALQPHYRGWNGATADHNYNWHDSIHDSVGNPCGNDSPFPCDDYGHGTHTTGTTSGDDGAGNQIGVAPGAKWIGCRNMDQGNGTPARYTECFQFMMAPTDLTGNNPNPSLRAHVINNSWTCPASEGCAPNTLLTIVQNVQAAGVFVEASRAMLAVDAAPSRIRPPSTMTHSRRERTIPATTWPISAAAAR
jgi:serine protease AprX